MESKQEIRERIWKLLDEKKVSRFPGARGRIPNFLGAERCVQWLDELKEWKQAKVIKANPDSPQRQLRWRALKEGKIVYMAVPRLAAEKPFVELDPRRLKEKMYEASSIKGAFRYGRSVSLEKMKFIDLVVCGSVAVNLNGERIGKGEGYSELEFALAIDAKKLHPDVPVITSVHPLQIVRGRVRREPYDFAVNVILTPEKILRCVDDKKRPKGIYWNELSDTKRNSIPVLTRLFKKKIR
jgi:5-formyltetrahydrofolate cyclo-ligase